MLCVAQALHACCLDIKALRLFLDSTTASICCQKVLPSWRLWTHARGLRSAKSAFCGAAPDLAPCMPHAGTSPAAARAAATCPRAHFRGAAPDLAPCMPACGAQFPGGRARSCEDLKARYYGVARALAVAREGSEEGAAYATLVKHPFNAQHERCAAAAAPPPLLSHAAPSCGPKLLAKHCHGSGRSLGAASGCVGEAAALPGCLAVPHSPCCQVAPGSCPQQLAKQCCAPLEPADMRQLIACKDRGPFCRGDACRKGLCVRAVGA